MMLTTRWSISDEVVELAMSAFGMASLLGQSRWCLCTFHVGGTGGGHFDFRILLRIDPGSDVVRA